MKTNPLIKRLLLAVSFSLGGITLLRAQTQMNLPLAKALEMAEKHSGSLRADSFQVLVDQSRFSQFTVNQLPQLAISSNYLRLSNNIRPTVISFPQGAFPLNPQILNQSFNSAQISELLTSGGKLHYGAKAAKAEVAAGREDLAASVLNLDFDVTALWYNLFVLNKSKAIIQANITVLLGKEKDLDNLEKQGIVLKNDVLKVDLAVTNLQSTLVDINRSAATVSFTLCTFMGIDAQTPLEIPFDEKVWIDGEKTLTTYLELAKNNRPELKAWVFRLQEASYGIKASRGDYYPSIALIGSFNYDHPTQRIIPNKNAFTPTAYAGASLQWKLSSLYTNHSKVSENKFLRNKLESGLQAATDGIRIEVNANYQDYLKTVEKIALAKKSVDQATEDFRVEQNKLNASTATPTDYLDANTRLLQAQLELGNAYASAELAYKKLIKSTGTTLK